MAILSMLPPLPEDLIIEILLRLPVKSLLRFESVSRGWHTIIRSPRFIHNHAHRGNNITDCLVYLRGGVYVDDLKLLMDIDDECKLDDNYACLVFSDGTFETHEVPDLPGAITDIVGHCNGIFCVLFWDSTLALWNPATRKLRSIPQGMEKPYDCDVGFGIDPLTGDVKVVLISNARYYHAVSIYCSRNDSWESSEQEKAFVDLDFGCWVNTFLNGFCYWIKCQWKSYKYTILTFDIHNDTFQEIEMPEMLDMAPTLDIYHDTLALLTCRRYCQRSIDMWLMKEPGRWTKHRTLSLPIQDYSPFGIWNNNYILASFRDLELIVCDLDSGTIIRTLELGITEAITSFLFPLPYKESLVSV